MRFLVFLIQLLIALQIFAQEKVQIESLLDELRTYQTNHYHEKIYLHLDKPIYTSAETIWFKVYTTLGVENVLSGLSNIAYVELINPRDEVITNLRIPLVAGLGVGDIALPDTLTEGTYRLRAYTRWMQNFDSSYFYDRTLSISNGRADNTQILAGISQDPKREKNNLYHLKLSTLEGSPIGQKRANYEVYSNGKQVDKGRTQSDEKGEFNISIKQEYEEGYITLSFESSDNRKISKTIKLQKTEKQNSLQFFPEGGIILSGKKNRIAYKALQSNGLGIAVSINIMDDQNQIISSSTSNPLGMGSAHGIFEASKKYFAEATFDDNTLARFELPEVQNTGVSILVNNFSSKHILAELNLSEDLLANKQLVAVVQANGKVVHTSYFPAKNTSFVVKLPKDDFPTGVLQLTLLDQNFSPLLERMIFNYDANSFLDIQPVLDKKSYTTREKVNIEIETIKNNTDTNAFASLSAAVINTSKLGSHGSSAHNILTNLLLESDVKGYIESPASYFKDPDEIDLIGLDELMLTQAWRKVDWQSLDTVPQHIYEAEKDIQIKGTIHKFARKAVEPQAEVTLLSTENYMNFIDTTANDDGQFVFDKMVFPDSIKFLISAKTQKGKNNLDIRIDDLPLPDVNVNKNAPEERNDVNATQLDFLKESARYFSELQKQGLMDKSILIEEVVVNHRVKKYVPENSSNLNGPGNADAIISGEDLELCPTLEICLQGRIAGVIFQNGMAYSTRNPSGAPLQLVLDGMYLEADQLSTINAMDVASVEVLRSVGYTTIYGMHGGNGLLIITSKTGADARRNHVPKGILTYSPKGYHVNRAFYKPEYDVAEQVLIDAQDLRTTIHWEPLLLTDEHGNTKFDFFTSDERGTYEVTVEGIDWVGRIVRKVVTFEVN